MGQPRAHRVGIGGTEGLTDASSEVSGQLRVGLLAVVSSPLLGSVLSVALPMPGPAGESLPPAQPSQVPCGHPWAP